MVAKDVFQKDVETEEFTGLKNYLSSKLEVRSRRANPATQPSDAWEKVVEDIEGASGQRMNFVWLPYKNGEKKWPVAALNVQAVGGSPFTTKVAMTNAQNATTPSA
jgi:hypothetical protein